MQHSLRRKCWLAHTSDVAVVNKLLLDGSVDSTFAFIARKGDASFLGVTRILSPFRQVVGSPYLSCEVRMRMCGCCRSFILSSRLPVHWLILMVCMRVCVCACMRVCACVCVCVCAGRRWSGCERVVCRMRTRGTFAITCLATRSSPHEAGMCYPLVPGELLWLSCSTRKPLWCPQT